MFCSERYIPNVLISGSYGAAKNIAHVLLPVEEYMFVFFKCVNLWTASILLLVDKVGGLLEEKSEFIFGEAFVEEATGKVSWKFQVV